VGVWLCIESSNIPEAVIRITKDLTFCGDDRKEFKMEIEI
jgi:hypothetical protein